MNISGPGMHGDIRFRVGERIVDPRGNRVMHGKEILNAEPKVMELFTCLAERPGRTVTRDAILERVWKDVIVSDDALNRSVYKLRKLLGDDGEDQRVVETVTRSGYRLNASQIRVLEPDEATHVRSVSIGILSARATRVLDARISVFVLPPIGLVLTTLLVYGSGLRWTLGVFIVLAATLLLILRGLGRMRSLRELNVDGTGS